MKEKIKWFIIYMISFILGIFCSFMWVYNLLLIHLAKFLLWFILFHFFVIPISKLIDDIGFKFGKEKRLKSNTLIGIYKEVFDMKG